VLSPTHPPRCETSGKKTRRQKNQTAWFGGCGRKTRQPGLADATKIQTKIQRRKFRQPDLAHGSEIRQPDFENGAEEPDSLTSALVVEGRVDLDAGLVD
jgi:hypothetical protein